MGEFEKALSYSDLSIRLAQQIKNPYAEAAAFHYRGIIHDQQGQWDLAIKQYENAQKVAEKAGDMFRVYIVKFMEGRAYHMAGNLMHGQKLIEDSIALGAKIGTKFLLGQAKSLLADCHLADDRVEDARLLCTEAVDLAEKAGDRFTRTLARRTLGEILGRTGQSNDLSEAKQALMESIKTQEEIGATPELARSYLCLAQILKMHKKNKDAVSFAEQAARLFANTGMQWDTSRVTQTFGLDPRANQAGSSSAA